MRDFERKQNKPRKGAPGKTINALLRLDFLQDLANICRLKGGRCVSLMGEQAKACTAGHKAGRPCLPSAAPGCSPVGGSGSDTEALTVLSSEDPLPSPLSQHHVDPGIDEDSHSKGQVEGHH